MFSPLPLSQPHFQTCGPSASTSSLAPRSTAPTHYAPHGYSGDGWRQMLLPIPSHVSDPYQFLDELRAQWEEETRRLNRIRRERQDGSSIPPHMVGKWARMLELPCEVWRGIAREVVREGEGATLARVSRDFQHLLTPLLLASPHLASSGGLDSLLLSLTSSPSRILLISSLSLQLTSSADWAKAGQLGSMLKEGGADIKRLKLKCAGSDTGKARELFGCFRPEEFEWTTSPCWLIRPSRAFADLLTPWCTHSSTSASAPPPCLRTLRLSGFFLDDHFLEALLGLASLEKLVLFGRTVQNIPIGVLRGLLGGSEWEATCEAETKCTSRRPDQGRRQLHLTELSLVDLPRGSAQRILGQVEDLVSPCGKAAWRGITRASSREGNEVVILSRA